jgi:hypothetical protein
MNCLNYLDHTLCLRRDQALFPAVLSGRSLHQDTKLLPSNFSYAIPLFSVPFPLQSWHMEWTTIHLVAPILPQLEHPLEWQKEASNVGEIFVSCWIFSPSHTSLDLECTHVSSCFPLCLTRLTAAWGEGWRSWSYPALPSAETEVAKWCAFHARSICRRSWGTRRFGGEDHNQE